MEPSRPCTDRVLRVPIRPASAVRAVRFHRRRSPNVSFPDRFCRSALLAARSTETGRTLSFPEYAAHAISCRHPRWRCQAKYAVAPVLLFTRVDVVAKTRAAFRQNLEFVPVRLFHGVENAIDELEGDFLVEEIAHRIDEDHLWFAPP